MSCDTLTSPPPMNADPLPSLHSRPWLTLAAVALGVSMIGLDSSVVSLANPAIGQDLQASAAGLQWITNAYLLALAATLILGGKLGDRFGRRTVYLTGVTGFTLASVAIGLSGSIEGVIVFRAAQGFFGSLMLPSTLGILRAAFPAGKFTMAVGIWAMVSSASTALGPIVGGVLVEHVNWESVFYINAPLGIITMLFGILVLPHSRNAAREQRFDIAGIILLAVGQFILAFSIVKGETWGWTSGATLGSIGAGVAVLALFGWHETQTPYPLLPIRLFRNLTLTIGASMNALKFFIVLGSMFYVMFLSPKRPGHEPRRSRGAHPAPEPGNPGSRPCQRRTDRTVRCPADHADRPAAPRPGRLRDAHLGHRLPLRPATGSTHRDGAGQRHGDGGHLRSGPGGRAHGGCWYSRRELSAHPSWSL